MSKWQRQKGAVGEREAARVLSVAFPNVARRAAGEESQENQGRDLKNTPGFVVQVQLAKTPTPERKFLEAWGARLHGEVAVALTRRSAKRKKGGGSASGTWLATLFAADFAHLVAERDRMTRLALEHGETALRIKNESDALIRERDAAVALLERSRAFDSTIEGSVHPSIQLAAQHALAIVTLEREVAALKEKNAELAGELAKALWP